MTASVGSTIVGSGRSSKRTSLGTKRTVPRTIYLLPNIEYLTSSSTYAGYDAVAVKILSNKSPSKEGSKGAERCVLRILRTSGHSCPYSP